MVLLKNLESNKNVFKKRGDVKKESEGSQLKTLWVLNQAQGNNLVTRLPMDLASKLEWKRSD